MARGKLPTETNETSEATGTTEAVRLESVYKAFVPNGRRADPLLALEDVTFTVRPGEFVSLVGPSGCGKSTVLNLLAGLARPSAGSVTHRGQPVHGINREIGYITQDDNLLPWRTTLKNVEFGLELRGLSKRERRERAREFLELVGLGGFENHYPHELSGGMRKRASIVRTLVYDSPVVLMDEPFGPLDAQTRVILQDELLRLWERQRPAVLFVTHDLVEAIALSDRILTFTGRPGRIKQEYVVRLPRPRDVYHIHELEEFQELYNALWADIRDELAADRTAPDDTDGTDGTDDIDGTDNTESGARACGDSGGGTRDRRPEPAMAAGAGGVGGADAGPGADAGTGTPAMADEGTADRADRADRLPDAPTLPAADSTAAAP